MKMYQNVRSTEQPETKVIDDYSVWIADNIVSVTEQGTDEEPGFSGYEYDLTQYTKDEYISLVDERSEATDNEIIDLLVQVASIEVESGNLELESISESFRDAVKVKIDDDKMLDK